MSRKNRSAGFAIALAWPQTYCKQPGAWYDPVTLLLGINHNHYYKVGHAALVLIDTNGAKAHYFDFGRYHAPYKHGRVRWAETDHELAIKTIPQFTDDGKQIVNDRDILEELQANNACHGEGNLIASYCPIDFEKALAKANEMIENSPIPYGPFQPHGSNCSRFVNTVIRAGKPDYRYLLKLKYCIPLTPTPKSNVHALAHRKVTVKPFVETPFRPTKRIHNQLLKTTLPPPDKNATIPSGAQWLSGEGAGSWFHCKWIREILEVTRYSAEGIIECSGMYKSRNTNESIQEKGLFTVTYPSNCQVVSLHFREGLKHFYRTDEL
ncbi:MAG: hypothetical protein GVY19_05815 [Bacteroidetes bacterium]|jgi:hypothetical protein|nr:hypothetical protein [Bacteroidota bacterium]